MPPIPKTPRNHSARLGQALLPCKCLQIPTECTHLRYWVPWGPHPGRPAAYHLEKPTCAWATAKSTSRHLGQTQHKINQAEFKDSNYHPHFMEKEIMGIEKWLIQGHTFRRGQRQISSCAHAVPKSMLHPLNITFLEKTPHKELHVHPEILRNLHSWCFSKKINTSSRENIDTVDPWRKEKGRQLPAQLKFTYNLSQTLSLCGFPTADGKKII